MARCVCVSVSRVQGGRCTITVFIFCRPAAPPGASAVALNAASARFHTAGTVAFVSSDWGGTRPDDTGINQTKRQRKHDCPLQAQ